MKYGHRHKYKFFNSRKELLNYDTARYMPWRETKRCNRMPRHDGYYLLMYDYFQTLEKELFRKYGLVVKQYYCIHNKDDYEIVFTIDISVTAIHSADEYFDCINPFVFPHGDGQGNVNYSTFYLSRYIVRKDHGRKLRLCYYSSNLYCNDLYKFGIEDTLNEYNKGD